MGVYYNGVHSVEFLRLDGNSNEWKNTWDDFHLIPTSRLYIANPGPKYQIVQLPNMNDRIDITNKLPEGILYGMRIGEWEFLIDHDKWSSWSDCYRALVQYFHGFRFAVNLTDRENADEQKAYVGRLVIRSYSPGNDYSKIIIQYQLEKDLSNDYTVPHWEPYTPPTPSPVPDNWAYGDDSYISAYAYANNDEIYGASFRNASYIEEYAFSGCYNLNAAYFPACSTIGSCAFFGCSNLSSVYFPICKHISLCAFEYCINLATVSFPNCLYIGPGAFACCEWLSSIYFPDCTSIGFSAFSYCGSLGSVYFPACLTIEEYAFTYCRNLSIADFPVCRTVGSYAFNNEPLLSISFPECTFIGAYAFEDCYFSSIYFPKCTSIGSFAFSNCASLRTVSLPALSALEGSIFYGCSNIQSVYLSNCVYVYYGEFYSCTSHIDLYLAGSSRCDIGSYTYLTNNGLTIHVPESLISTYWVWYDWQYHSEDIVAL